MVQRVPNPQGPDERQPELRSGYAKRNKIRPDEKQLEEEHAKFLMLLKSAGFTLHIIPFPEELNKEGNLKHDGIFVRDVGLFFKDYWIKASFSVNHRKSEADAYASFIAKKFRKKIIKLPKGAFLEFGEVFYLRTKNGAYYFGGLSRSNKKGHEFVESILKPDRCVLIKSKGYHLDTVFSPVLDQGNRLCAFIVAKNMLSRASIKELKKIRVEMIYVDPIDSSGKGKELGSYAINTLIAPGLMLNCARFATKNVEAKLRKKGIKRFVSPLTYFRFAGGSYHCLTNEEYE